MREIKFRAWCISGNRMLQNVGIHPHMIKKIEGYKVKDEGCYIVSPSFDDYVIEQFTGLKDKNGVDIYEGDICRILYTDWPSNTDSNIELEDYLISISHVGIIAYEAPEFGIVLKNRYDEDSVHSLYYGTHGRIEIIGNIHESTSKPV